MEIIKDKDSARNEMLNNARQHLINTEALAERIKEKTLGQSFTIRKLNRLTGASLEECKLIIRQLSTCTMIEVRRRDGIEDEMTIVTDPEKRLSYLNMQIEKEHEAFRQKIAHLEWLKSEMENKINLKTQNPIT